MSPRRLTLFWFALICVGCGGVEHPRAMDPEGRSWVRLSDEEPIVASLRAHAAKLRCETVAYKLARTFAEIELVCERECHSVKRPLDRGVGIEQVCSSEVISVMQLGDMLGFACSSLPAEPCERLVQALSNGRDDSMNAVGGKGWGI